MTPGERDRDPTTHAEVIHALSVIKALCCGEASDHGWAQHFQTTCNRGRIADICDEALATLTAGHQTTGGSDG